MPKRLCITAPHVVEVMEYTQRDPGPGEVLVHTEYASGKHGTTSAMFDMRNFKGQRFDPEMRLFIPEDDIVDEIRNGDSGGGAEKKRASEKTEPKPTGTSGTGVVERVGEGVTRWKPGDRVVGLMHVSETNVVPAERLWLLGEIDPLQALCLEPAYVSIHSVRESHVRFGDTVAVVGLGAIGLIAVQMARRAGARLVFAVDPLENRRDWALEHGADAVFDPAVCNPSLEIHRLTDKRGVDVAIEVSGSYAALETAIKSTRICGTVCSAGFYQGESKGLWLGREWHHNRINIVVPHGCGWGHPPRDYPGWDEHRAYSTIVEMLRGGLVDFEGLIDPLVPIEETPEVFRLIDHDPGKVIKYGVTFA